MIGQGWPLCFDKISTPPASFEKSPSAPICTKNEVIQADYLTFGGGVVRIGKDVYLMNHIECPGVLIECGFVSNPAEARLLENQEYQLKLAAAIVGGYIQSIS